MPQGVVSKWYEATTLTTLGRRELDKLGGEAEDDLWLRKMPNGEVRLYMFDEHAASRGYHNIDAQTCKVPASRLATQPPDAAFVAKARAALGVAAPAARVAAGAAAGGSAGGGGAAPPGKDDGCCAICKRVCDDDCISCCLMGCQQRMCLACSKDVAAPTTFSSPESHKPGVALTMAEAQLPKTKWVCKAHAASGETVRPYVQAAHAVAELRKRRSAGGGRARRRHRNAVWRRLQAAWCAPAVQRRARLRLAQGGMLTGAHSRAQRVSISATWPSCGCPESRGRGPRRRSGRWRTRLSNRRRRTPPKPRSRATTSVRSLSGCRGACGCGTRRPRAHGLAYAALQCSPSSWTLQRAARGACWRAACATRFAS